MTTKPYDPSRIVADYGRASYSYPEPDPIYRELFPEIAKLWDAAQAANEEGRRLYAAENAALRALRDHQRGLSDDAFDDGDSEAKLAAAHRKAEKATRAQSAVAKRALIAYDKAVLDVVRNGGAKGVSRERAVAAHARVIAASTELLASLKARENSWNLAGQPLGLADVNAEPGEKAKRMIETQNLLAQLERILGLLGVFPDLSRPEPTKGPAEIAAEVDRQNAEAVAAVRARSKREGY